MENSLLYRLFYFYLHFYGLQLYFHLYGLSISLKQELLKVRRNVLLFLSSFRASLTLLLNTFSLYERDCLLDCLCVWVGVYICMYISKLYWLYAVEWKTTKLDFGKLFC